MGKAFCIDSEVQIADIESHELAMQMADDVARGRLRPQIPASIPVSLADLLRRCWAQDPRDRPTIAAVIATLRSVKLEHYTPVVPRSKGRSRCLGRLLKIVHPTPVHYMALHLCCGGVSIAVGWSR